MAAELLSPELPVVGGLGEREQLLVAAWLTWQRDRRAGGREGARGPWADAPGLSGGEIIGTMLLPTLSLL